MAPKRPERTARRERDRAARRLVKDRERLAALSPGGAAAHPINVDSAAVIDARVGSLRCPQCDGSYTIDDHQAPRSGERRVAVRCRTCHVARAVWFRIGSSAAS